MPKKRTINMGNANTGVSPSVNPAKTLQHEEMNEEFEKYAAMLSLDDPITLEVPESNYKVKDVDVEMLSNNPAKLEDKPFGSYFRGRLKGMDELVSTASVRTIAKGLLKTRKPTPKQLINVSKFLNALSAVRLPTAGSGFSFKNSGKTMQHNSSKSKLSWGTSGQNHGEYDRARREAVLKTFSEHVKKGSSTETTLRAMIRCAITHTLNVFTAPLTAKNLKKLNSINDKKAMEQVEDREREKERAKYLGAKQRTGNDHSVDRDWDGEDRSDISEDRFLGDELEKKIRLKGIKAPAINGNGNSNSGGNGRGRGRRKTAKLSLNGPKIVQVSPAVAKKAGRPAKAMGVKKLMKPTALQKHQKKTLKPKPASTATRKSPRLAAK